MRVEGRELRVKGEGIRVEGGEKIEKWRAVG